MIEAVAFIPQNGMLAAVLGVWTLPVEDNMALLKENVVGVMIAVLSIILLIKYGYMLF